MAEDIIEQYRNYTKNENTMLMLNQQRLTEIPISLLNLTCVKLLRLDFNYLVDLPNEFCESLPQLVYLSLQGNNLTCLPENIGLLMELKELHLNENDIVKLPTSFSLLTKLEIFHIVGNNLQTLPSDFGNLENLRELAIDENLVANLPISFCQLFKLERFDASQNQLNELPTSFGSLISLRLLDLTFNKLNEIPQSVGELTKLEVIDFSDNSIHSLPDSCKSQASIQKIYLDNNQLKYLPSWFKNFENLEELSIKSNELRHCPFSQEFGFTCPKLRYLDLSGNQIEMLPKDFGCLKCLEFLDMGSVFAELERRRTLYNGNFLTTLPANFGLLTALKELRLDENQLEELPESFGLLSSLEFLDLGHNCLQRLPNSFCHLSKLTVCLLSINSLVELPENFGKLEKLVDLRLDNNKLSSLPASFEKLTGLETLDLYCNKLTKIPSALKDFVNLKRLDLLENDLGIPDLDVPEITYKAKYVVRDPNFKDNWRGRKRPDILDQQIVKLLTNDDGSKVEESQIERLQHALKQSGSIWRNHEEATQLLDQNWSQQVEEQEQMVKSVPVVTYIQDIPSEDYWDSDFYDPYGYREYDVETMSNSSPKPANSLSFENASLFCPADIHAKSYRVSKSHQIEEDGQFEDAD